MDSLIPINNWRITRAAEQHSLLVWIEGVAWAIKWKSVAALSCWFETKYVKRSSFVVKGNGSGIVFSSSKVADPRRQCVLLTSRPQNQAACMHIEMYL